MSKYTLAILCGEIYVLSNSRCLKDKKVLSGLKIYYRSKLERFSSIRKRRKNIFSILFQVQDGFKFDLTLKWKK